MERRPANLHDMTVARDPESPWVRCWHVILSGEIAGTVYFDDGWTVFANRSPGEHFALDVPEDLDHEPLAIRLALSTLHAAGGLHPRDVGMDGSRAALPWRSGPEQLPAAHLEPAALDDVMTWMRADA